MKEYRKNGLVQIVFWLLVIGSGPRWVSILLAELGLWPDPNFNPIGPELLFFFTFWLGVACLGIEVFQVWRKQRS